MMKSANSTNWFARPCEKYMLFTQRRSGWGESFSLYTGSRLL